MSGTQFSSVLKKSQNGDCARQFRIGGSSKVLESAIAVSTISSNVRCKDRQGCRPCDGEARSWLGADRIGIESAVRARVRVIRSREIKHGRAIGGAPVAESPHSQITDIGMRCMSGAEFSSVLKNSDSGDYGRLSCIRGSSQVLGCDIIKAPFRDDILNRGPLSKSPGHYRKGAV